MFSGIVEEAALVVALEREQENLHITLACSFAGELKIDQSVAHNGVCLTVVSKTDTTYMEAVGSWTVPDPIAPDSAMGFELRTEGRARSIRMATLCYHGWSLTGERGKILLTGESIGNGQTIPFTETGLIARGADGRLTLVIEGSSLRYVKEE